MFDLTCNNSQKLLPSATCHRSNWTVLSQGRTPSSSSSDGWWSVVTTTTQLQIFSRRSSPLNQFGSCRLKRSAHSISLGCPCDTVSNAVDMMVLFSGFTLTWGHDCHDLLCPLVVGGSILISIISIPGRHRYRIDTSVLRSILYFTFRSCLQCCGDC